MSIKSLKPSARSKYIQGYFVPKKPKKYIGDVSKIIYRSSWEFKFCKYCDKSPDVVKWSSEPIGIPYIHPLDGKRHIYNVDFYMEVCENGIETKYLIEIKPKAELVKPESDNTPSPTLKQLRLFKKRAIIYITNRAKFLAASEYARVMGYKFKVITEDFLFKHRVKK